MKRGNGNHMMTKMAPKKGMNTVKKGTNDVREINKNTKLNLKIATWNIRSIHGKEQELIQEF